MAKHFIKAAIKHPGALHRAAEAHHALNADGTINLEKMHHIAVDEHNSRLLHEVDLAETLGHMHHGKDK